MENKHIILNELQEISTVVANLNKQHLYAVPQGYFDALETEILTKAKFSDLLNDVKVDTYSTPKGYFNDFSEKMLVKAKSVISTPNEIASELEDLAPLLNTIDKSNVYKLPDGYFEQLDLGAKNQPKAKVITFNAWKKITKYAAAAMVSGLVVLGAAKLVNGYGTKGSFDKIMAKSSEEELNQAIETHTTTAFAGNEDQEGYTIFVGTTEEELQQYLKEQPETAENNNKDI